MLWLSPLLSHPWFCSPTPPFSKQKKENVYPDGASVQFYKIYLDDTVKAQFAAYDVFAIIEWDVLVAHEDR